MKEIYVLGTSMDIKNLGKRFFDENVTIGINHSYKQAWSVGSHLKYWLCLDGCMQFFDEWFLNPESRNTVKYAPAIYMADPRFHKLLQDKWKAGDMDLKVFERISFFGRFQVCHVERMEGIKIDVCKYTIFSAISLAYGLGAEKIILRGVNLEGNRFCSTASAPPDRSREFQAVKETIQVAKSFLILKGIEVENQSYL